MTPRNLSKVLVTALLLGAATVAYAQRTSVSHSAYSVTTSSTVALNSNGGRNFLILENDSDTTIYCAFDVPAIVNRGIRLAASGGALLLDVKVPSKALNCVHGGTGSKTLLIVEGVQ